MILEATHTHLYPGHRGKISGASRIADIPAGGDCLIEFTDGSAAAARILRCGDGWQLDTEAYRSAAGTDIVEKVWRIQFEEIDDGLTFRIFDKVTE